MGKFDQKLKISIKDKFEKFADNYDLIFTEEIPFIDEKCKNIILINLSNVTYKDLYEAKKKIDLLGTRINGIINFEKTENVFLENFKTS